MADQPLLAGVFLVAEGGAEQRGREIGAERAADLDGLDRAARGGAAANFLNDFSESEAEGRLEEATVLHVAGDLEGHGAARAADS